MGHRLKTLAVYLSALKSRVRQHTHPPSAINFLRVFLGTRGACTRIENGGLGIISSRPFHGRMRRSAFALLLSPLSKRPPWKVAREGVCVCVTFRVTFVPMVHAVRVYRTRLTCIRMIYLVYGQPVLGTILSYFRSLSLFEPHSCFRCRLFGIRVDLAPKRNCVSKRVEVEHLSATASSYYIISYTWYLVPCLRIYGIALCR